MAHDPFLISKKERHYVYHSHLNNIAKTGLAKLPEQNFVIDEKAENPEGIILRSFDMHKMELNENLLAVARAGAGTNNIPIEKCTQKGVPVFNTPGANANAVKELVLAGLFASSRRIIAGAAWVQGLKDNCENVEKAVEAGKKEFTGPEIAGKTLGVIGLGAIGVQVANAALDLGMEVIGYDPFLSLESAWHLSPNVVHEESMEELVAKADYITLHIPLNDKTRNTFDEKLFAATKPGARLLNFARGGLVDNAALKKAIADGIIARYMTDSLPKTCWATCEHHRNASSGASTPESEENCAIMAAQEIREYLPTAISKFRKLPQTAWCLTKRKPRITVMPPEYRKHDWAVGCCFHKIQREYRQAGKQLQGRPCI